MFEREPDFEDEKIRAWSAKSEDQKGEEDPTVLSLDVEKEEVFESRTYCFRPTRKALFYLINSLVSQCEEDELDFEPEEIVRGALELLADASFKFLAKRRKEDGLISSILVAVALGARKLLWREEWVEEAEYRRTVRAFERHFLPQGILTPPQVITLEEWRRYSQLGHPDKQKGPQQ